MAEQDLTQLMESVDARASKKATGEANEIPQETIDSKKDKKNKKKKGEAEEGDEDEKLGIIGKLIMTLVALIIIAVWLAIFALLIKMDVGGFGSTVLFPVLKDVPYVNMILPGIDDYLAKGEDQYYYETIDEAVVRIKELEQEVELLKNANSEDSSLIEELQASADELAKYKANEATFEEEKEKFYEEVVFSDNAPDINAYKSYYESIEPDNAEAIYKQVVTQLQQDKELEDYVKTYSSMKPKNAAAIFDAMTDDYDLICQILTEMDAATRSDILSAMNTKNAAVLTKMMEP